MPNASQTFMQKKAKPPKRGVDQPKVRQAEQRDRRQHEANRTAPDKRRSREQDDNTGIAGVQRPPADS